MRRLNPEAQSRDGKPAAGRKPPPRRRPAPRWRAAALRAGSIVALALLVAGGIGWVWYQGIPAALYGEARQRFLAFTADSGYRLRQVVLDGRRNTPREDVMASLAVHSGQPLFDLDPTALKARLESLGWVRSAVVERRLPDILYVRITEAVPAAVWQENGAFRLIDRDGKVISDADVARFARLPVVVGAHAPEHTAGLLDMLAREPELAVRVRAAVWVGERRWNLRFDNGVDVKLPADSPQLAWSLLARMEHEQSLLARDVEVIDMRLPDRLVVRLGPAAELQRQPGNDT
jgi:cell division protein FtsQ